MLLADPSLRSRLDCAWVPCFSASFQKGKQDSLVLARSQEMRLELPGKEKRNSAGCGEGERGVHAPDRAQGPAAKRDEAQLKFTGCV